MSDRYHDENAVSDRSAAVDSSQASFIRLPISWRLLAPSPFTTVSSRLSSSPSRCLSLYLSLFRSPSLSLSSSPSLSLSLSLSFSLSLSSSLFLFLLRLACTSRTPPSVPPRPAISNVSRGLRSLFLSVSSSSPSPSPRSPTLHFSSLARNRADSFLRQKFLL